MSGVFYPTTLGTYAFAPKIGRLLSKLFWTVSEDALRDPAAWRSTVAESFLILFPDCDLLTAFLRPHLTTSRRVKIDKFLEHYQPTHNVDWDLVYCTRYGLDPEDVKSLITHLAQQPERIGRIFRHPIADLIIDVDELDPGDRIECQA